MSTLRIPPPTNPPPSSPPTSSGPPSAASTGVAGRWAPVAAAGLLFAASVIAAIWLASSAPESRDGPSAEPLTANAQRSAYGGDAYTGIQNAAADTEHAVIAGNNTLTELATELHDDALAADDSRWNHLYHGVALLLVLIGAANFVLVWQRSSTPAR